MTTLDHLKTPRQLMLASMLVFCAAMPWSLALMQIGLVLVLLSGYLLLFLEKRTPQWTPFFYLLALYILLRFISIAFSPDSSRSFRAVYQQDWTLLLLPLLATVRFEARIVRLSIRTLLISAAVAGIYGCIQMFVGIEFFRGKNLAAYGDLYRATGGYSFYLTFAGNQLMFFAFLLGAILAEKRVASVRYLQAAMLAVILFSILATFGRSAWLAVILSVGVGTLLVNRKLFLYAMSGVAVLGATAMILSPDIQERVVSIFDMSKNAARLNLWLTSVEMIKANPLFGVGPGLFNAFFETYKVPGVYDAYGHSHNDYLNIAVNSGLFTLFIWLTMWVSWYVAALRGYFNRVVAVESRQILLGSILAVTAILFAALFQCYYTDLENNIVWLFLAGMALNASNEAVRQ